MVFVEGGAFEMGSDDHDPRAVKYEMVNGKKHSVTVKSFYMSKYEVTQIQWRAIMGSDPLFLHNKNCDNCPVETIPWNEAKDFLAKLNRVLGRDGANLFRLPTEEEWEYAGKGGKFWKDGFEYSGSNNLDKVGWYEDNHKSDWFGLKGTTHIVGSKEPNKLGIFDMSGNVAEWCEDLFNGYLGAVTFEEGLGKRVFRGGGWNFHPWGCRLTTREFLPQQDLWHCLGFRIVCN